MRHRAVLLLALALAAGSSRAGDGIVAVLERSQEARLERMMPADPATPRARTVRASLEALMRALRLAPAFDLRVIEGDTVAETLQGRVIVANEALGDLPEGERTFILAHELGHVVLRHWEQTERLYLKWVPGAVTPEETDPVAALLGRDASGLAHRQELEADAWALRALRRLGHAADDAVDAFKRLGSHQDTATHPGTRKRLATLRAVERADRAGEVQAATTLNDPIDSARRPD